MSEGRSSTGEELDWLGRGPGCSCEVPLPGAGDCLGVPVTGAEKQGPFGGKGPRAGRSSETSGPCPPLRGICWALTDAGLAFGVWWW